MAPESTVRMAAPGDEDAICGVRGAGIAASPHGLLPPEVVAERTARFYNPGRVRREIDPAPPHWLGYVVAERDGRVVGACGGSLDGDIGHVLVLYVDLELRGQGVGSALLYHVTAQHRACGAVLHRVFVTEGNEMGLPFYRARGFRQVGREPFGPPGGAHSLIMERPLPPR